MYIYICEYFAGRQSLFSLLPNLNVETFIQDVWPSNVCRNAAFYEVAMMELMVGTFS